jgi:hypothetical protein
VLLSNTRIDIILLVFLGMTICAQGGIGRIAVTDQWTHPQSIFGYILGVLILLEVLFRLFDLNMMGIHSDQQTLLVMSVLIGLKFVNSAVHYLLFKS